jgi:endonuclease/exonuclease/phosphatase (EEP) superfamily protein YafD
VDHGTLWFKNSETRAGIISFEETVELENRIKINRNLAYPMEYKVPKNLIWTLLSFQGKVFRNITTHFTATQKCTETLQMIQEAQNVCDFVQNTKDIPTIFSGDLNIHQQASCIATLKSNLNLVNEGSKNTLTPSIHSIFWPEYIARDHNLINGLSVDYVFQKGLNVLKYEIPEVEVSDHLPVVVEFEII